MSSMPAPELSPSLEWLNAPAPTLASLHGRAVVLAFWSASSAWCHTLLEQLRLLQARHPEDLQVLAIHVPKFDAERAPALVRKAVHRLGIGFPVAHDRDYVTWQHYGIRAWPSVALVDRAGMVHETIVGDDQADALGVAVQRVLDASDVLDLRIVQPLATHSDEPRRALSFPSGIAASDQRLYVADSGHNRVLECSLEGRLLRVFGTGHPDLSDGARDEACFRQPRGLALQRDMLYVADTGNHALRRIDLAHGKVTTLVGSGQPGVPVEGILDDPRMVSLDQPWALAASGEHVAIAMAGRNQIWTYELAKGRLRKLSGSGDLGLVDGTADSASFAHPASLALVQKTLYVCDSASSALRSVQLANGAVQTLVGNGLFEFGDQDGPRGEARLQCPLAIALDPNAPVLWVVDSYNGSLRQLRLGGGELRRFPLAERLHEPAAIAVGAGALWIAETHAHQVLRVAIDSGQVQRIAVNA